MKDFAGDTVQSNSMGGGNARMSGMGTSMKGSGDAKTVIFNVMKEMSKTNKMINKHDIWAVI